MACSGSLSAIWRARRTRDGQRDEVLLRAVVEVAFDPAALGVGRLDDAGTGLAELVGLAADRVE